MARLMRQLICRRRIIIINLRLSLSIRSMQTAVQNSIEYPRYSDKFKPVPKSNRQLDMIHDLYKLYV